MDLLAFSPLSFLVPQLTFLSWFDPPQSTVLAGQTFPTFSVIGDLGVTDRVLLEEQCER